MGKRRKDGTFEVGNNFGEKTRFTSENQPENSGRKPSRFKQLIQALPTYNEEVISKEDYTNIISHLLTLTPTELQKIASNPKTPIAVILVASSILGDIENKNLGNTRSLVETVFGKEPEKSESNIMINYVSHASGD